MCVGFFLFCPFFWSFFAGFFWFGWVLGYFIFLFISLSSRGFRITLHSILIWFVLTQQLRCFREIPYTDNFWITVFQLNCNNIRGSQNSCFPLAWKGVPAKLYRKQLGWRVGFIYLNNAYVECLHSQKSLSGMSPSVS